VPHTEYIKFDKNELERRKTYRGLFKAHVDHIEMDNEIRCAINGNYVLGNTRFQEQISKALIGESLEVNRVDKKQVNCKTVVCPQLFPGKASTQFYMTELDEHAKEAKKKTKAGTTSRYKEYKNDVEKGNKGTFGIANRQSVIAVRAALEGKRTAGKDGTASQQNAALSLLPSHGRSTWFKYVDGLAKF